MLYANLIIVVRRKITGPRQVRRIAEGRDQMCWWQMEILLPWSVPGIHRRLIMNLPTLIAFWFAWYAFHPDTEIHTAK